MRLGRIDGFRVEQLMLKTAQTIQERNTLCDNERQILFNAPLELRLVVAMRKEHTHTYIPGCGIPCPSGPGGM